MSNGSGTATAEFLDWLLPADGYKALCIFRDLGKPPRQLFFMDTAEMARVALEADREGLEVYHACAAFTTDQSRKAANVVGVSAFWLDVDCGPGKPYASAGDGYRALGAFVERVGLPVPLVVASGAGLHVYWGLDGVLDRAVWEAAAGRLRELCDQHGFHVDDHRTTDAASILRPPGTHNRKYGEGLDVIGGDLPDFANVEKFLACLRIPANTPPSTSLNSKAAAGVPKPSDVPSMTQGYAEGGRTNELTRRAGWCLGPWHMSLDAAVAACLAWDNHNTPPLGAEVVETTVANIYRLEAEKADTVSILPDDALLKVPYPFYFSAKQQLMLNVPNEKKEEVPTVVSRAPVYVVGYRRPENGEARTVALRFWHPHDQWQTIVVPWDDTTPKTVSSRLTMYGLNIFPHQARHYVSYVQRAIDMLADERPTELEYEQLGWKGSSFLLGHELMQEGQSTLVGVGAEIRQRAEMLKPAGTYAGWASEANKLFAKGLEGQAFMLLASFAAPLMRFRLDAGGCIVSAVSQDSGTGKSTAIEAVASVWGNRDAIDINRADTINSRFRSIALLANLPVVFDEMRNRDPEVVKDFILTFTDGRDKNRLNQDGTLRRLATGWSTILISASNLSLAETVSYDNETAQAARVLEYRAELPADLIAADGTAMRQNFRKNRGQAGRMFMHNLVCKEVLEWVAVSGEQYDREFAAKIGGRSTETRFYSALLASVKCAGLLLRKWNMLELVSLDRILDFGVAAAGGMRQQLGANRLSPTDILTSFVNEHWHTCLSVQDAVRAGTMANVRQAPRSGYLYMRHEEKPGLLLIDAYYLKKWCVEKKFMLMELRSGLEKLGVLKAYDIRRNLGMGTPYSAAGNAVVWQIDALHPAMGGLRAVPMQEEDVA